MTTAEKSRIFRNYNLARNLVRDGLLDEGRLNRGLGIAQLCSPNCPESHIAKYGTTPTSCTCPDYKFGHGRPCKGLLALMLQEVK